MFTAFFRTLAGPAFMSAILAVGVALPVQAHNALITVSEPNVEDGETVDVVTSISGPFGTFDMPFYVDKELDYEYGPVKIVAIAGGTAKELEQTHHGLKDGTKKRLSKDDITSGFLKAREANPDGQSYSLMPKVFNSNIAEYRVVSKGTVSFVGMSTYGRPTQVKNFMKTFVNLANDGESTKARASELGFSGMELRPVEDLANVKPGGTVKVEALLDGKPQSGVIVYLGVKDLPESERIASVDSYANLNEPFYSAAITDQRGIALLRLPELRSGAKELGETYLLTEGHLTVAPGFRYRATITFKVGTFNVGGK